MNDFATAAGHWYGLDGSPQYTTIGRNGNERNTTLRDARQNKLVPSVTTILRMAAAPQLEKWKRNQVLLSALTLPRIPNEPETDWLQRVEQDWQAQGRAAADRGTAIHAAIEKHYRGEQPDEYFWPWVVAAKDELMSICGPQEWSAERSFACSQGYGGKTDLHCPAWVLDVKSKDGDPTELEPVLYDEHLMQLRAYRNGLGLTSAKCGILFVGRDIAKAKFVQATDEQLTKAMSMFSALLSYWQAKTGHYPAA